MAKHGVLGLTSIKSFGLWKLRFGNLEVCADNHLIYYTILMLQLPSL